MKVALVSDIHANAPALRAVLDHAAEQSCQATWNLGDMLGYGPHPDEVLDTLRALPEVTSVIGNYDAKVLRLADRDDEKLRPKSPAKYFAFRWAYDQLSEVNRIFLRHLPPTRRVEADGMRCLLTHAGGDSDSEIIDEQTPPQRLAELAEQGDAEVIGFGHSHQTAVLHTTDAMFVNPGPLGRPDDGNPRASYAVLDFHDGQCTVTHHRIEYDWSQTAEAIRRRGLPEAFAQMILQGRPLNAILANMNRRPAALQNLLLSDDDRVQAVLHFAETCHYEAAHAQQVTFLALRLFDELEELHALGETHRFWLGCAGLLHDIGWLEGQGKHHKVAMELIAQADHLPFRQRERHLIAAVARYHRKALPKESHFPYNQLQDADRYAVRVMGGLLRVADGLDRSHRAVVKDIAVTVDKRSIVLSLQADGPADEECLAALKKGDLLKETFYRSLEVTCGEPVGKTLEEHA